MNSMLRLPENQQKQLNLQKSTKPMRLLKKAIEPVNSNEIWLLTLSDLLMLLMIFFVFLLAAPFVQSSKAAPSQPVALPVEQPTPAAKPSIKDSPDSTNSQAVAALESDLTGILSDREGRQGVTVERRSQLIVVTFPEQILFDSGQAEMKTAVGPTLEKVAAFIISHPELSVEVQGHTDDRPIRNQRYPSNWELSADRATQVAKMLVERGVDPTKIATKGFGEYHPIVPNESDTDRLKNRRVEIQFSRLPS
jgi:chemotaxis protein MotB